MNISENQKLNRTWSFIIVLFIGGLTFGSLYIEYSRHSTNYTGILIRLLLLLILVVIFTKTNLQTTYDETGMSYRLFPFNLKTHTILWKDVETATVRPYSALKEFGGWGIRYNYKSKLKAFVVSGSKGIEIKLKDGNKRFFSSNKSQDLEILLKQLKFR